jgi:hypothetical protein
MTKTFLKLALTLGLAVLTSGAPAAAPQTGDAGAAPAFQSIGPLTFGADGVLFAADTQAATIYAVDLAAVASGTTTGTKPIANIDRQIAGLLGTDVREIAVTDLAVHPKTGNAYISVMRGQGAGARPVLLRADGAGKLDLVDFSKLRATRVALPNPPSASADGRAAQRTQSITDMAFMDGRLYVAGLSNEEFASKLRTLSYPFTSADAGTSVEIYHGNHGQFETRSPVYTFVPFRINNEPHLIAGYLCTPLVKFPVSGLKPGAKILGTTVAELGNRNRPLDMVLYRKGGREFLLMSNNSRGVMKIPTDRLGTEPGITARVDAETGGIAFEPVPAMKGIEQLDLLNDTHTLVLARTDAGALNLDAVALP